MRIETLSINKSKLDVEKLEIWKKIARKEMRQMKTFIKLHMQLILYIFNRKKSFGYYKILMIYK